MPSLQILAKSIVLSPTIVEGLNEAFDRLVKIVKFELMDTGFFEKTDFKSVILTLIIVDSSESKFWIEADEANGVLRANAQIDNNEPEVTPEEQAVLVLQKLVEHYDLDSRIFKVRAFDLQSARIKSHRQSLGIGFEIADNKPSEPYVSSIPQVIPVEHDEYYARIIGTYGDGNQFWGRVAAEFDPSPEAATKPWQDRKKWYGILHRFDKHGEHLGTDYKFTGTTADGEDAACEAGRTFVQEVIDGLGPLKYGNIGIKLFTIRVDGMDFGLIDKSDHDCGDIAVMEPGSLTFYPPWDGNYDT